MRIENKYHKHTSSQGHVIYTIDEANNCVGIKILYINVK